MILAYPINSGDRDARLPNARLLGSSACAAASDACSV